MKKFLPLFVISLLLGTPITFSQSLLIEVPFEDRIDNADAIVEGKILQTRAFWNKGRSMIYTSNVVRVYKIFKGSIQSDRIEIVTEGGRVGNDMLKVTPGVRLTEGETGIFFLVRGNKVSYPSNMISGVGTK